MIKRLKKIFTSFKDLWKSIDSTEKDYLLGGFIIISLIGLFIIFFFPWLLTRQSISIDDYKDLGGIGDTINGISGPFIALLAAFLTFLAFYVQFKANKQQREQFQKQLDDLKVEQEKQDKQHKLSQFENQFYEMLRLHKENVNEIFLNFIEYRSNKVGKSEDSHEYLIYGRKTFEYFVEELELLFAIIKYNNFEKINLSFQIAYNIFFLGIKDLDVQNIFIHKLDYELIIKDLTKLKDNYKSHKYKGLDIGYLKSFLEDSFFEYVTKKNLNYDLFQGYSAFLGHYYRHLFQIVKFVVYKEFLSYEEKRNYLRILRAQLSNHEQVMLYYNWKARYGHKWENETNHFFTDYRMIHNIDNSMLIPDFKLEDDFDLVNDPKMKETGRENDPLFEFQDKRNEKLFI